MKIEHFKEPFYHTIISDFFTRNQFNDVLEEINSLNQLHLDDDHHKDVLNNDKTESIHVDSLYEDNREKSQIIKNTDKLFLMDLDHLTNFNPFLGFVPLTSTYVTFISKYKNGSKYSIHHDHGVLTFLTLLNVKPYTGGELVFTKYDYTPPITNNSCLIFPSYEKHKVNEVVSEHDGHVRHSINQRIYIQ